MDWPTHQLDQLVTRVVRYMDMVNGRLTNIESTLSVLLQQGTQEMSQIDDLNAAMAGVNTEIEKMTQVNQQAVTLLNDLKAAVDDISNAPDLASAIQMAKDAQEKIAANDQLLADTVAADTPAPKP